MSIKEIQIQDKDGNIYHPSTNSTVVKYNDITVQEKITDLDKTLENIKAGTSSNTIDKKYSYDVLIENDDQIKVEIPYEYFDKDTDSLDVFINGLAVPDNYYTVTNPANNQKGYITLTDSRSKGTIIKFIIHKNVPAGDEGSISGSILKKNSIPADRVQGLSNPNLLINGNFRSLINQRRESVYNLTNTTAYTIDRWNAWAGSSTYNSMKLSILNNGLRYDNTSTSTDTMGNRIRQPIDMSILSPNSCVTLSIKVSSVKGKFIISLAKGNMISSYAEDTNIIWLLQNAISKDGVYTFTTNVGEIDRKFLITDIANVNPGSSMIIEWVKLEVGDKATPFIPRLYGEELSLCQRYYEMIMGSHNFGFGYVENNSNVASTKIHLGMHYAPKRVSPTLRISGLSTFCLETAVKDFTPILIKDGYLDPYGHGFIYATIDTTGIAQAQTTGIGCRLKRSDTGTAFIELDSEIY